MGFTSFTKVMSERLSTSDSGAGIGGSHCVAVQVASLQHWHHHSLTVVWCEVEPAPCEQKLKKEGLFLFVSIAVHMDWRR